MSKVNHIVLLSFKPETSEETVGQIFDALLDLSESIDGIENYSAGPNNSPQSLSQGYTHGFVMTFSDAAARDAYLTHPEHVKFEGMALPHIASVAVFDYEV
jgi:hypothetical protein